MTDGMKPTAMLGGISIFASFIIGVFCFFPEYLSIKRLLLGAGILFIVGLIDDLYQIKPYAKLATQLVASAALIFSGNYLPWTQIIVIDVCLTFVWLVGLTNALNMLDNMDGLASGISIIACIYLSVNFIFNLQYNFYILPLLLAAAIGGFFLHNFHPASIFMGDCGSLFIGFTMAGISLFNTEQRTRNIAAVLATPVLIMLLPIFDTTIVTISRRLNGRPVSRGGNDHASHRLVALGMSDKYAVMTLYFISALSGLLAIMVRRLDIKLSIAIIGGCIFLTIFFGIYLGKVIVYDNQDTRSHQTVTKVYVYLQRVRLAEVVFDFILIILSFYVGNLLKFDGQIPLEHESIYIRTLPYIIAIYLTNFFGFGIYRESWRLSGVVQIVQIWGAIFISSIISFTFTYILYLFIRSSNYRPLISVFIISSILILVGFVLSRLAFQLSDVSFKEKSFNRKLVRSIYIYGTNERGKVILSELNRYRCGEFEMLGFIDNLSSNIQCEFIGYSIFAVNEVTERGRKGSDILFFTGDLTDEMIANFRHNGFRCSEVRLLLD